jgi:hypothetical protein
MKPKYIMPVCDIIPVVHDTLLLTTSREAIVGNTNDSPNKGKDHYDDPTGPISGIDGGESLGKKHSLWSDDDDWH